MSIDVYVRVCVRVYVSSSHPRHRYTKIKRIRHQKRILISLISLSYLLKCGIQIDDYHLHRMYGCVSPPSQVKGANVQ